MRLIDTDELKENVNASLNTGRETFSPELIYELVDEQPTAYDVDKVVEQLEKLKDTEQDDSVAEMVRTRIWNKAIQSTISVVKGGGVNG